MDYLDKIGAILDNILEANGDNLKAIDDVRTWLQCEWLCSQISFEDYLKYRDMVFAIAAEKIKMM